MISVDRNMASKEGTRKLRQPRKQSATASVTRKAKTNEFLEKEPVTKQRITTKAAKAISSSRKGN